MSFSVSPQLRVVLLAMLLAVLALVLSLFVLAKRNAASDETTSVPAARDGGSVARSRSADSAPKATSASPRTRRPAVPLLKGVPLALARALATHQVVVVSLWTPGSESDELAYREAENGASRAGAGFVRVDVARDGAARILVERLGVLETPAVLVYRRGDANPAVRLPGFADREVVAQAVDSVRLPRAASPSAG